MSLDRQQEVAEHDLVIKTLEPLEAGRKCFRLVRLCTWGRVWRWTCAADAACCLQLHWHAAREAATAWEQSSVSRQPELLGSCSPLVAFHLRALFTRPMR